MTGAGYAGRGPNTRANPDVSKYPKHVPTVREQLEGSTADLDPDGMTQSEVERYTALGVLVNPTTLRTHLETEYEPGTQPSKRTHEHSSGGTTVAHERGPDHEATVYPSEARE